MMMMMRRVMCVLAVVLCCACGYTMTAAATTANTNGHPKAAMSFLGSFYPEINYSGSAKEKKSEEAKALAESTLAEEARSPVEVQESTLLTNEESPCGGDAVGSSSTTCPSVRPPAPPGVSQPQAGLLVKGEPPANAVAGLQGDLSKGDKHLGVKLPSVSGTSSGTGSLGSLDPSTVSLTESQGGGGNNGLGGHGQPSTVDRGTLGRDSQTLTDSSGELPRKEKEAMQEKEMSNMDPKRREGPHKPAENQPGRGDSVQTPRQDSEHSLPPAQAPDGPVTSTSPTAEERVDVPTAEGGSGAPQPSPPTSATGSSDVSDAMATKNNTPSAGTGSTGTQESDAENTESTTTNSTTLPPELANNKKGDADSSSSISSSVWVRVPLLIVVTLACILVC
ncbi:uncharacterized protein TM35_001501000 [Trypanosoma theileri]|uniref:Mucin-associated surface protein (MASP) n=1 Tax=Trypanosoma theileri TaxID=67003 RepID=A0A1X0NF62_9TRYP|nr:uncharacterized protein TM35_001501000 [Trypanosoma theileri]ORC80670.1 hypothetical protein TM35_001501000 [Trypanosoma theileri]